MTEQRPGRKALFSGAPGATTARTNTPDEIAQHVRQLNEDLALALKGAAAKKATQPLDASNFGSEYATLVDAVNTALVRLQETGAPAPADAGEYTKKIDILERRLEFMEKNNPVPMLNRHTGTGYYRGKCRVYRDDRDRGERYHLDKYPRFYHHGPFR